MKRPKRLVLFLLIAVSLLVGVHYYLWSRWFQSPNWSESVTLFGGVGLITLLGNFVFVFFSRDRSWLPKSLNTFLTQTAYVWLGAVFLAGMSTAFVDVACFFVGFVSAPSSRVVASIAIALSIVIVVTSLRNGIGPVKVLEVAVQLNKWPKGRDGFTIVQLSDVHIGPILKRKWLSRVVERVNEQKPDLIVITGDLIDGPIESFGDEVGPLSDLQAEHGVYYVTGNHEFYANVDPWLERFESLGLHVLGGRKVSIESAAGSFDLLGIHDRSSRRYGEKYQVNVDEILKGRDRSRALIALAHQPAQVGALEEHGVDLQLSGHTHGGQIWPISGLVNLEQPYLAGLYRHDDNLQVYVSRGTGFWGPPMRWFAPAEITKLVISKS